MKQRNLSNLCLLGAFICITLLSCTKEDGIDEQTQEIPKEDATQPEIPTINGHEYVDLGLSVKWATANIEAEEIYDYGGYYCWGESKQKYNYNQDSYEYYKNGKYQDIGRNISGTDYDVAKVKWGASWRLPTKEECEELISRCTYLHRFYVTENSTARWGGEFTGPNGNKIFLPFAGSMLYTSVGYRGTDGAYLCGEKTDRAYIYVLGLDSKGAAVGSGIRYMGYSVRPVSK